MLTGPEQRRLRQIEQALAAEDPRLARSLQDTGPPAWRPGRRFLTLAIVAALVLLVISVVATLPALFLLSATATVAAVLGRTRLDRYAR